MPGILFPIIAGVLMSLQGVFNTRVSDKVGLWGTTTLVHVTGLIFSIILLLIVGVPDFRRLKDVNKLYILGGTFGVIIVYSIMKGISLIGTTFTTALLLISQLLIATFIDYFGLFGSTQVKLDFTKVAGLGMMIGGIIIFKLKG